MSIFNRQYIYVIVYMSSAPGGFNIGHCVFQAKRLTITELNTYMGKINETAGGKANIINMSKSHNSKEGEKTMSKKIRWFEWGDERPGYVTTWTVGANGSVVIGRRITLEEARRSGYEFECPFA